uniref:Uncharacterized protein n=1 Tax=Romanomermis culicivorax TaxID=13658 RepID=A0A915IZD3_ROMCU
TIRAYKNHGKLNNSISAEITPFRCDKDGYTGNYKITIRPNGLSQASICKSVYAINAQDYLKECIKCRLIPYIAPTTRKPRHYIVLHVKPMSTIAPLTHNVNGIDVELHAFKINNHDRDNEWVSIGEPILVKNRNGSIYEFGPENIVFQLQLLADDQRAALLNAAKLKNPNLKQAFIHLIPLQSIMCETAFFSNGETFKLRGAASNLNEYRVTIRIPCLENSEKRHQFIARIQNQDPVEWNCAFTADSKERFVNRIEILADDVNDAALDHDLFGPHDQVYVTRNQMNLFSQEIRKQLLIEEDYELDDKFDETLIDRFISIASSSFEFVQIDKALEKLSKLGFSEKDLEPDEI